MAKGELPAVLRDVHSLFCVGTNNGQTDCAVARSVQGTKRSEFVRGRIRPFPWPWMAPWVEASVAVF